MSVIETGVRLGGVAFASAGAAFGGGPDQEAWVQSRAGIDTKAPEPVVNITDPANPHGPSFDISSAALQGGGECSTDLWVNGISQGTWDGFVSRWAEDDVADPSYAAEWYPDDYLDDSRAFESEHGCDLSGSPISSETILAIRGSAPVEAAVDTAQVAVQEDAGVTDLSGQEEGLSVGVGQSEDGGFSGEFSSGSNLTGGSGNDGGPSWSEKVAADIEQAKQDAKKAAEVAGEVLKWGCRGTLVLGAAWVGLKAKGAVSGWQKERERAEARRNREPVVDPYKNPPIYQAHGSRRQALKASLAREGNDPLNRQYYDRKIEELHEAAQQPGASDELRAKSREMRQLQSSPDPGDRAAARGWMSRISGRGIHPPGTVPDEPTIGQMDAISDVSDTLPAGGPVKQGTGGDYYVDATMKADDGTIYKVREGLTVDRDVSYRVLDHLRRSVARRIAGRERGATQVGSGMGRR